MIGRRSPALVESVDSFICVIEFVVPREGVAATPSLGHI